MNPRSARAAGIPLLLALAVLAAPRDGYAADPDPGLLVGAKKCKICHKKAEEGNQWQKWLDGPHAKAFATLGTDKAKAVAAELGIDDPQASGTLQAWLAGFSGGADLLALPARLSGCRLRKAFENLYPA